MTDQTTPPTDDEIIEQARAVGLVEPEKAPAFVAAYQAEQERRAAETTHQGPHPEHGGLETHIGTRDQCTGPDCGPPDPEDEIREAVLDLEALHTAAHGTSWRIAREEEDVYDTSCRAIGIEPTDGDADIVVFQADDISEEDAAYIAAMDPGVGRLLADLLHEIAEGMTSSTLTPIQEAARQLAHKINNRP